MAQRCRDDECKRCPTGPNGSTRGPKIGLGTKYFYCWAKKARQVAGQGDARERIRISAPATLIADQCICKQPRWIDWQLDAPLSVLVLPQYLHCYGPTACRRPSHQTQTRQHHGVGISFGYRRDGCQNGRESDKFLFDKCE